MVYLLASLVSTPMVHGSKLSLSNKEKGILLAIAFSGAVIAPTMFFLGLEQTTASDAALLSNGEIIFSVMLALLFFKEKLRL